MITIFHHLLITQLLQANYHNYWLYNLMCVFLRWRKAYWDYLVAMYIRKTLKSVSGRILALWQQKTGKWSKKNKKNQFVEHVVKVSSPKTAIPWIFSSICMNISHKYNANLVLLASKMKGNSPSKENTKQHIISESTVHSAK